MENENIEGKKNYIINERIYDSIDKLTDQSQEMSEISMNLMTQLKNLLESIEDETCEEILADIVKLNDFISYVVNISKNELQEIKEKSQLAIEKANKRKQKILNLKEENASLEDEVKNIESEKQKLILNIDSITTELSEMYQENQRIETKTQIEIENKKKENLLKEKYMKQIDDMQRDMDNLRSKNEKYEQGMINIRRKSMILEQHNKTLTNQLGNKSFQFLMKVQQENELQNKINTLNQQNEDLYKKIKFYQTQVEKWKEKYKILEAKKSHDSPKKKMVNIKRYEESPRKKMSKKREPKNSSKNISNSKNNQDEEKNESDYEYLRYNTYSNLNDLLGSEQSSESSSSKSDEEKENEDENNLNVMKNNKLMNKKKVKTNFKKYSFDLDSFIETKFNLYENFFFA
jgi:hypothetical protein